MKVQKVNTEPQIRKNSKLKAARNGAMVSSAVLFASTGISWALKKTEMENAVKTCGGKIKYAQNFVLSTGIIAAAGALTNVTLSFVSDKINPKKSPKAAN